MSGPLPGRLPDDGTWAVIDVHCTTGRGSAMWEYRIQVLSRSFTHDALDARTEAYLSAECLLMKIEETGLSCCGLPEIIISGKSGYVGCELRVYIIG